MEFVSKQHVTFHEYVTDFAVQFTMTFTAAGFDLETSGCLSFFPRCSSTYSEHRNTVQWLTPTPSKHINPRGANETSKRRGSNDGQSRATTALRMLHTPEVESVQNMSILDERTRATCRSWFFSHRRCMWHLSSAPAKLALLETS